MSLATEILADYQVKNLGLKEQLQAARAEIRGLREALERIMNMTIQGIILVEKGLPNCLDATVLDNIAREALAKDWTK